MPIKPRKDGAGKWGGGGGAPRGGGVPPGKDPNPFYGNIPKVKGRPRARPPPARRGGGGRARPPPPPPPPTHRVLGVSPGKDHILFDGSFPLLMSKTSHGQSGRGIDGGVKEECRG